MLGVMRIQESFYCRDTKMVKGDLTISSLALTKGALAVKSLRQGGYPGADHNTLGVYGNTHVFG